MDSQFSARLNSLYRALYGAMADGHTPEVEYWNRQIEIARKRIQAHERGYAQLGAKSWAALWAGAQ